MSSLNKLKVLDLTTHLLILAPYRVPTDPTCAQIFIPTAPETILPIDQGLIMNLQLKWTNQMGPITISKG